MLLKGMKRIKVSDIDLLDGSRRGEVIFRRVFFLLTIGFVVYFLLLEFVGKKEEMEFKSEDVQAQGVEIEDKVEWINGDRVTTKADGSVQVVPAEVFMGKEELEKLEEDCKKAQKIKLFFTIKRGNAPLAEYADEFIEVANKYELDYRLLPAIATIESGGGKHNFRSYNAWGWGDTGFNSFEEGIEVVAKGLKIGYINKGRDSVEEIALMYCPPNYKNWSRAVDQFMAEIENMDKEDSMLKESGQCSRH